MAEDNDVSDDEEPKSPVEELRKILSESINGYSQEEASKSIDSGADEPDNQIKTTGGPKSSQSSSSSLELDPKKLKGNFKKKQQRPVREFASSDEDSD